MARQKASECDGEEDPLIKASMNISQIQENLENILSSFFEESFIFELLLAYGIPRATITLLKTGKHNLSKIE